MQFEFEHARHLAVVVCISNLSASGEDRRSEDRCPVESSLKKYKSDEAIYRVRSLAEKAADVSNLQADE